MLEDLEAKIGEVEARIKEKETAHRKASSAVDKMKKGGEPRSGRA